MLTKSGSRGMCGVSPILLVAVIVVFAGCSPPATEISTNKQAGKQTKPFEKQDSPGDRRIHFIDLAEKFGIRFTYRNGEEAEQAAMLESMGGGVAFFDYDSDGNLDLFFPGGGEFEPIHVIRGVLRPCSGMAVMACFWKSHARRVSARHRFTVTEQPSETSTKTGSRTCSSPVTEEFCCFITVEMEHSRRLRKQQVSFFNPSAPAPPGGMSTVMVFWTFT